MYISFELPFHGHCTEHQLILHSTNSTIDWMDLNQLGLEEMPNVIILNSKRFKYSGVADGRGQYCQED